MGAGVPLELGRLLSARDDSSRAEAWDRLIAQHSPLLLRVARSMGGGHDAAMDRYTFVLDKLRQDDFRRLRIYSPNARARFTTWLVVVARRLCLDQHRKRYGRARPTDDPAGAASMRAARHRLADSFSIDLAPDHLPDAGAPSADRVIIRATLDADLRTAVAELPARDRLLLALRFEDDLSASHIAGILGYPTPFHVYRLLNAVCLRLRHALEARGIQGSDG
jgi:RNA polymerase sigma factor (sigma-70 family)